MRTTTLTALTVIAVAATIVLPAPAGSQTAATEVLHEYFEYSLAPANEPAADLPHLPQPGRTPVPGEADASGVRSPGAGAGMVLSPGGPIPTHGFLDESLGGLRNGPATPHGDVTLDRETGPEGLLRYQTVFEPSVVPWKRASARDDVDSSAATIAIGVRSSEPRPVSIGGGPPSTSESFVGRITVLASEDEPIPFPSVAPDMAIHAVRVTPPAQVTIHRDSADNYLLTLNRSGEHAVEMDVSAPRFYFGGPITETGAMRGRTRVSTDIADSAATVIEAIGVHAGMTELETVRALTAWFRDFAPGELPLEARTGDVYRDIALSRLGVCRHRAQAFVITAAALGIPARYVHNEAHAFVEVSFAGQGWRRIDLGGGAAGLETFGDESTAHQPGVDPFGRSGGADGSGPYERRNPDVQTNDEPENATAARGGEQAEENAAATSAPDPASEDPPQRVRGGEPPNGAEAERPPASGPDERVRTTMAIVANAQRVYRGEALHVSGRLATEQRVGLADREIQLVLVGDDDSLVILGLTRTAEDGTFADDVTLPDTLQAGTWDVRGRYAGDDATLESEGQ